MFSRSNFHSAACFVTGGVIGNVFFDRVIRITRVEGPSMLPLFQPQDRIIGIAPEVWCLFQKINTFTGFNIFRKQDKKGEPCFHKRILVCEMSPGMNYCKVGYIDEKKIIDEVKILGINSKHSKDSRDFGDVPLCSVKSVVMCKITPKFEWLLGKEFEIK
jgi:signal peptidase I